jgi:NAD(P)-dependent dehydrogenase (short-subunit alcohol dehydrogenase family)
MDLQLSNKTALVTGATAGIGLAIARRLAAEGAKVVIAGRTQAKLDAAVESIRVAAGAHVTGVLADPATTEGAAALLKAAPSVDILVNNLGIYEIKNFIDITDEDWRRYFEVNVLSGARLARAYLPGMLEKNWGRIIFVSSESGLVIPGPMIHYGMTKTAQLAISRGLAELTRGTNVTVNSVLPGPTRSEGIVDFLKSLASDPQAPADQIEREFFAKGRPSSLLQRMIEPEEIANLVAYVASSLSSATNGAALRVDGGVVPTIG